MTRHAHPRLHLLVGRLFSDVLKNKVEVQNPFLLMTKGDAAQMLRQHLNKGTFLDITKATESCWNLNSRQVIGKIKKDVGEACGICIPCIVRRTALRQTDVPHAADFTHSGGKHFRNQNARVHVDSYRAWAKKMVGKRYSLEQFNFDLPYSIRDAIGESGLSEQSVFDLYKKFAREVLNTFPAP